MAARAGAKATGTARGRASGAAPEFLEPAKAAPAKAPAKAAPAKAAPPAKATKAAAAAVVPPPEPEPWAVTSEADARQLKAQGYEADQVWRHTGHRI